jgi:hypothetical protein
MGVLDEGQPQQYPQQQYQQPPVDFPIPEGPTQDFFTFRLDSSDIIDEILHQLKGEIWKPDGKGGGKYVPKFKKQMTEEGINDVISIIYSFGVNKNVILGCLTHEEIYQRCNSIWKELAKYIVINGKRVGVDKRKRSLLVKNLVYQIHSALSRSEEGRESDQLSTASQRVEHFVREDKPKQGGILNTLNPFKKNR